ncbi:hypothetical protein [Anaerophilus nitritogenes]|uniref:hypothetical protein n=1 Tax=Anaerophilus nitritogenes TaxID=2498136 RepID=UPI00101CBE73|nr:hypothetical protein [Anaerophilus nitritogenes]
MCKLKKKKTLTIHKVIKRILVFMPAIIIFGILIKHAIWDSPCLRRSTNYAFYTGIVLGLIECFYMYFLPYKWNSFIESRVSEKETKRRSLILLGMIAAFLKFYIYLSTISGRVYVY